jgi:hypothetical protein
MLGIKVIISLLREINLRIAHMALDTTKLVAIVGTLSGNVTTLIGIARKGGVTSPADQAAVDAIEQSLEGLNTAVAQADTDLAPPAAPTGATGPDGTTGATGTDTGTTGSTGPAA